MTSWDHYHMLILDDLYWDQAISLTIDKSHDIDRK